jgi:uncharacterized membrane protein
VRAARFGFLILAVAWLALLLAAPVTAAGTPLSGLTYLFGSLICHQRPERSFHLAAAQLPVCGRCFGLYAGAAAGALIFLTNASRTWCARPRLRMVVLAAAVPTVVTWTSEVLGLWSPDNLTRFAAALPLGAAVALTVNYVECARPPRTGPSRPPMRI